MNPETPEADLADQLRDVHEDFHEGDDEPDPPSTVDIEADPADVSEQHTAVPSEEEDRPL